MRGRLRMALGVLAGGGIAAFGALVLGEYPLTTRTALLAGPLFGLAVGEAVLVATREGSPALGVMAALLAAIGLIWGAWISAGRDWSYVGAAAWVAVGLGAAAAALWVLRSSAPPAADTTPPR